MQNWLAIAAAVYLAAMILMGHYKGFIRMAVSAASLIITLIAVNAVMPQVTSYPVSYTHLDSDCFRKEGGCLRKAF